MGATESPPWDTVLEGSGRDLGAGFSDKFDVFEGSDAVETVLIGENDDIADPGRAGIFLAASVAFFCANMVSRSEGLGGPVVLLENPKPGRETEESAFLGELGLAGSISNSLCWVVSNVDIMLRILVSVNMGNQM